MVLVLALYEVLSQEVTHRGEWRVALFGAEGARRDKF